MKKAILVDAENREVKEVEINDWKDIAPAIGADLFTIVSFGGTTDAYVDDEGLLKNPTNFIMIDAYPEPLAGSALLMDTDDEGESVDVTLTVEEVKAKVKFMDIFEVRALYG